ncbi:MAG: aminodeoxychorismate lyase [Herminiimonas sp.]|nr:aminodeoxychorismate lyase [Herminiimonas sp.]
MKKFLAGFLILLILFGGAVYYWAGQPILDESSPSMEFTIKAGSGVRGAARQIAEAGIPVQPWLLELLARVSGKSSRIKAGTYEIEPGTTPTRLVEKLVRGEFAQESLAVIEGWTFKQMREAIAAHQHLKHDTASLSEKELLAKVAPNFQHAEGIFFPDTYLFAKGASDLQVYRQAHSMMMKKLDEGWAKRAQGLPYKSPYEALIMASIVEKETGQKSERNMIAGVFVNRLKRGMLLQTDPTVIYGMGEAYQGTIRKRDLQTDTPYNTYTRAGLPPTPIALPGVASLTAALDPARTEALYFVSRGDGTSHFSSNLNEHNQAVNKFQR